MVNIKLKLMKQMTTCETYATEEEPQKKTKKQDKTRQEQEH